MLARPFGELCKCDLNIFWCGKHVVATQAAALVETGMPMGIKQKQMNKERVGGGMSCHGSMGEHSGGRMPSPEWCPAKRLQGPPELTRWPLHRIQTFEKLMRCPAERSDSRDCDDGYAPSK